MCEIVNFKSKPSVKPNAKVKFDDVVGERRENFLMETAMRFQEIFDDMFYAKLLDLDKIEESGSIERLMLFREWAREFEYKYYGTPEYNDDFIALSEEVAIDKISAEFGNGLPAIRADQVDNERR